MPLVAVITMVFAMVPAAPLDTIAENGRKSKALTVTQFPTVVTTA